jgi:CsoR family transcriptional regulator, copper-sensing transcriptional repressor
MTDQAPEATQDRAAAAERRFAVPVVLAALASVPATFLTMFDGTAETVGHTVNYASLAVLTAETVVLFVLAGDRVAWLKAHWWVVAIAVVSIPAVIFAVGPVQALRLIRVVGALRIIRVGRIIRAGKILHRRAGFTGPVRAAVTTVVTLAAAAFVALVLTDPTSETRRFLDRTLDAYGTVPIVTATVILAIATYVVARARANGTAAEDGTEEETR